MNVQLHDFAEEAEKVFKLVHVFEQVPWITTYTFWSFQMLIGNLF